jgi:alkanesulfonate monooxygenase SsuD/methylene tetrahydromethanopterin reductase-like flavin-dependent oxidoreductase (luciferase family)
MRVGFTMDFRNPRGESWRDFWDDRLWLMVEAEAMGFDYLMVQEHFFQKDGYAPSVPVFLDAARRAHAHRAHRLVRVHPAAAPRRAACTGDGRCSITFAAGRLDVTVGAGHNPAEYLAWGYSPKTRPSRMEEGLEVLKLAWTQRPFSFKGRYYDLENIHVAPEPLQKPHPPLWVAANFAAGGRAGRPSRCESARFIGRPGVPRSVSARARGERAPGQRGESLEPVVDHGHERKPRRGLGAQQGALLRALGFLPANPRPDG